MGLIKKLLILLSGFALGLMVSACASTFPYPYWIMHLAEKKLEGPTPADDKDLSICEATQSDQGPCSVMMTQALLALKKDYKDTKDALIACQQRHP